MINEYTEMIENNYPRVMLDQYNNHIKRLERELRKSKVKIGNLQKRIVQQESEMFPPDENLIEVTHDKIT